MAAHLDHDIPASTLVSASRSECAGEPTDIPVALAKKIRTHVLIAI